MFRQQNQVNCMCSFFPSTSQNTLLRNPFPSTDPRAQHRSKKSLKCHSNSRKKQSDGLSSLKEQIKELNQMTSQQEYQPQFKQTNIVRKVVGGEYRQSWEVAMAVKMEKEMLNNINLKQKHKKAFVLTKENSPGQIRFITQPSNCDNVRAFSPLNPFDCNSQVPRRVFPSEIIKNQYDLKPKPYKMMEVSPPHFVKITEKNVCNSNATTLAGSTLANQYPSAKRNTQMGDSARFSTIHPYQPVSLYSGGGQSGRIRSRLSEYQQEDHKRKREQSRPKTNSNIYGLSRLSEIMNEREESQSIYDEGQRPNYLQKEGEMEYSRVLISCKKLMDQKNGVLEFQAHAKLFDYNQQVNRGQQEGSWIHNVQEMKKI